MQLSRRTLLQAAAALAVVHAPLKAGAAEAVRVDQLWPTYRDRFVQADGRVVDTGNGDISHSEGQGWGMLLAGAAGDWDAFDRIWNWTDANLRWSGAPLYAWKWDPKTGEVVDPNNASDGDILIAWALARAGYFTKRTELVEAARDVCSRSQASFDGPSRRRHRTPSGIYGLQQECCGDDQPVLLRLPCLRAFEPGGPKPAVANAFSEWRSNSAACQVWTAQLAA